MRLAAILLAAMLAACAPAGPPSIYDEPDRLEPRQIAPRPAFEGYGEAVGAQPVRWEAGSLARDFTELMFYTEWGTRLPRLLRWEQPVRISVEGLELGRFRRDVEALLAMIRVAAPTLDVAIENRPDAEISLRTAPRASMNRIAPGALCFFVPVNMTWNQFLAADAKGEAEWDVVDQLTGVTIFIPAYTAPEDMRACILEEITQALGPGNDIARLEDSIFNDDNAHIFPTSFDLLMLRVLYHPSMRTGMSEREALIAALAILSDDEFAPLGRKVRARATRDRDYASLIWRADSGEGSAAKYEAALRAALLAETLPTRDHRFGEAHRLAGFLAQEAVSVERAIKHLRIAEESFRTRLGEHSVRLARVRAELSVYLMWSGRAAKALEALDLAIPVLAAHGQDRRLAFSLRWRALSLARMERMAEASETARQALDWAAYVFGGDSRALAAWRAEFAEFGLTEI